MESPAWEPARARRVSPLALAATAGGLWGVATWGVVRHQQPWSADHDFVASVLGTLLFLPTRAMGRAIEFVGDAADRTFDVASWWSGLGAGVIGAAVCAAAFGILGLALRGGRRSVR